MADALVERQGRSLLVGPNQIRSKTPQIQKSSIVTFDTPRARSASPAIGRFQRRVAFDTYDNKEATDYSLTLRSKHYDYLYNRLSRTILIGVDNDKHSESALEWLMEELVEDGDEVICLRAMDPNARSLNLQEFQYRAEGDRFLREVLQKNVNNKKISVVVEIPIGKVEDMIQRMIQIYEPAILVVGTRGRSLDGFKGLLKPGSISKYCLQHSPVPVIVVRSSHKRAKRKAKRDADPARRAYREMLYQMQPDSTKLYSKGSTGKKLPPAIPTFLRAESYSSLSGASAASSREPSRAPTPRVGGAW